MSIVSLSKSTYDNRNIYVFIKEGINLEKI